MFLAIFEENHPRRPGTEEIRANNGLFWEKNFFKIRRKRQKK